MATISNGTETFTFPQGMIDKISSDNSTELDQNVMPSSGPMSNQGFDFSGVVKTISINGKLFDTTTSVTDVNNIRSMKIMKYWLEALQNGFQSEPTIFSSNLEELSVESGFGTTEMEDSVSGTTVTLNAVFIVTKVYKAKLTVDDEAGNVEEIPFTLELWVAGV